MLLGELGVLAVVAEGMTLLTGRRKLERTADRRAFLNNMDLN